MKYVFIRIELDREISYDETITCGSDSEVRPCVMEGVVNLAGMRTLYAPMGTKRNKLAAPGRRLESTGKGGYNHESQIERAKD